MNNLKNDVNKLLLSCKKKINKDAYYKLVEVLEKLQDYLTDLEEYNIKSNIFFTKNEEGVAVSFEHFIFTFVAGGWFEPALNMCSSIDISASGDDSVKMTFIFNNILEGTDE